MSDISKHFALHTPGSRVTILSRLAPHLVYVGFAATIVWIGMLAYAIIRMF